MPSMLSINQFAVDHGISRSLFYKLLKDGRGPKVIKIGTRTLVSSEAAAEWRARMERETEQAAVHPRSVRAHKRAAEKRAA